MKCLYPTPGHLHKTWSLCSTADRPIICSMRSGSYLLSITFHYAIVEAPFRAVSIIVVIPDVMYKEVWWYCTIAHCFNGSPLKRNGYAYLSYDSVLTGQFYRVLFIVIFSVVLYVKGGSQQEFLFTIIFSLPYIYLYELWFYILLFV